MRRVWIEILRKLDGKNPRVSPSMRRVWIEIFYHLRYIIAC